MLHIYRTSGLYFGFIQGDRLFDQKARYVGWVERDGSVWKGSGDYLGTIHDDGYVLRRSIELPRLPRIPKIPPVSPIPPIPPFDRFPRIVILGWLDALD